MYGFAFAEDVKRRGTRTVVLMYFLFVWVLSVVYVYVLFVFKFF